MTDDEFAFLADEAAEGGVAAPPVRRISLTLTDGRTLSALRWGTTAPEITLLHGAGLNAHTWDMTLLRLGRPALAIDLAGHGDSSWRDDAAYLPRVLAPDIVTALETWTDRPQVLVGHSLGGLTAAPVAAAVPERVAALAIVDITPGVDPDAGPTQVRDFFAGPTSWATRDELVDRALRFGLGGGSRRVAERGVFLNSRIRPDGRVEWKHHFAHLAAAAAAGGTGTTPAESADAVSAVLDRGGWDDLGAVTAPITLIRGERGYVTPTDAAEFRERLPAAEVHTLPRVGHNIQEDDPAALAEALRPVLGKN